MQVLNIATHLSLDNFFLGMKFAVSKIHIIDTVLLGRRAQHMNTACTHTVKYLVTRVHPSSHQPTSSWTYIHPMVMNQHKTAIIQFLKLQVFLDKCTQVITSTGGH